MDKLFLFVLIGVVLLSGTGTAFATLGSPVPVTSGETADVRIIGKSTEYGTPTGMVATANGNYVTWLERDFDGEYSVWFSKTTNGLFYKPAHKVADIGNLGHGNPMSDLAIFVDDVSISLFWLERTTCHTGEEDPPVGCNIGDATDIMFSRSIDDGNFLSNPVSAYSSVREIDYVWYDVDGDDAVAFYNDNVLEELQVVKSDFNALLTFNPPVTIDNGFGGQNQPDVQTWYNLVVEQSDNGNLVHLIFTAEDQTTGFDELYYSRSTNSGVSFSSPELFSNEDGPRREGNDWQNHLFLDDDKVTVFVQGLDGLSIVPAVIRSTNSGATFNPIEPFDDNFDCSYRAILLDSIRISQSGTELHHVCVGDNNTGFLTAHSQDMGATWTTEIQLAFTANLLHVDPALISASGENIFYFWSGIDSVNFPTIDRKFYVSSQDGGDTFSDEFVIPEATNNFWTSPQLSSFGSQSYLVMLNDNNNIVAFTDGSSINCIFCLPFELKTIFSDISEEYGSVSDFIFPNDASDALDTAISELMLCLQTPSLLNESCWIIVIADIGIQYDNVSSVTEAIANDPPDSNFEIVYPIPSFEILESDGITPSNILLVNIFNKLSEQDALFQAFLVTLERYQGALIADEPEFVTLQLTALQEYTDLIVTNQLELSNSSSEYNLLTQTIVSDGSLELLQQRLDDEGFSQSEFDILIDLGYTQTEILEIQDIIIDYDLEKITEFSEAFDDSSVNLAPLTEELEIYSNNIEEFLVETVLTPRTIKENALTILEELLEQDIDKKTKKDLDKAIESLQDSLNDSLWVDNSHLVMDDGKKVFKEEKKAVKKFMKIIKKDKESPEFISEISDVMLSLVDADAKLATIALDDAQAYAGEKKADKQIKKAENDIQKAEDKLEQEKFDDAIKHYKKAWSHAIKAMDDNMPEPEDEDDGDEDDGDDDEDDDDEDDDD